VAPNGSHNNPILPDNDPDLWEIRMKNRTSCLVWLPVDHRLLGQGDLQMPFLVLGDKYARAVKVNAQAQPVMFPLAGAEDIDSLLSLVDGVLLTGSPSNVHPAHFGETVANPALPLDAQRDTLTLGLVKTCIAADVPLLGICRGFQEINVALGGSLHQQVHQVGGLQDHRESKTEPFEIQYGPSHPVHLLPGSRMAQWAGGSTVHVNSLHGQGIARLADGLLPLAHADDGLVEAFEVKAARSFAVAVQWHPEWKTSENPFYTAIFKAFGEACRQRNAARHNTEI
jgi:putative glutamine amidotransferase